MSYREYFNIDPDYFPQVDKRIIEERPELWTKFYPHPSFVQLLKAVVSVLERKQKLSIWVDGAYGTGKSHAVLTLKKLIDATDEETIEYFNKYGLDNFLCKKLITQKNVGNILICHRYGSSDIQSDSDLIVAIQEGVEKALAEAGIVNTANTSLKNSLIRYFENEENKQSFDIYEGYAIEALSRWANRFKEGSFCVYSRYNPYGERVAKMDDLLDKLKEINKNHYPLCLESVFTNVTITMYEANSNNLSLGAACGINEETKGTFKAGNDASKLENSLKGAWKVPEYWKSSHSYIANLKKTIDGLIEETFNKDHRISIAQIYNFLKAEPYGFMPCNLTAFILGFILKEYANSVYSYSDNLKTVPLDTDKLATMIFEIIKQEITPDKHYKDKYIVALSEKERAFNKATSVAFDIPEMYCVSVTETRSRIREQMKSFSFPIWVIKYVLESYTFKTGKEVVTKLIDYYCGIANNKNMEGDVSDNDIAITIGEICLNNEGAADDLKTVLTKDNCKKGMMEYLKLYEGGKLPSIAAIIGDDRQYINQLQYKFNSDAANWVWNIDTVNTKIDELICEYEIIEISNKILTKNTSFADTVCCNI